MKKIILLFSHTLTEPQVKELKENWNCNKIIYMSDELKNNWMNVSNNTDINQFKKFLLDNLRKNNYVLIQGEWGLTYNMINFAKENNFIPLYAGTTRNVTEHKERDKVIKNSIFSHTTFKKY
jgi:uncharacterized protein MJ1673